MKSISIRPTLKILVLLCGAAGFSAAHAAPPSAPPPAPGEHFIGPPPASADTNGDGKLSKAEARAHRSATFTAADTDSSADLTVEELLASSRARWTERFQALDKDSGGSLALEEWLENRTGKGSVFLSNLYRAGDIDGSKDLSLDEFLALAEKVAHPVVAHASMDSDGNGAVSSAEFMAAKLPPPPPAGKPPRR